MSAGDIIKRIYFEVLFFILFPIFMTVYMCWSFVLLVIECFKVYPAEIHQLTKIIVYGKESS